MIIRVFFFSIAFHVWIIILLACCYTRTMFCAWRDVNSWKLDCSTTKNWNSCRLLKNCWQCTVVYGLNNWLDVFFRLIFPRRLCWVQLCLCFKCSIMIFDVRQTYWHWVKFNWHNKLSVCNSNARMAAVTWLGIFNLIGYWSMLGHNWTTVFNSVAPCRPHLWWDSW